MYLTYNSHLACNRRTDMSFAMFLLVFFAFFVFWAYVFWKISFSIKSKVLLSFFVKQTSGKLILKKKSWKWVFVKWSLFSINVFFYFHFDCFYRKCKNHWKIVILFWMLMKHKHFKFRFPYRSTKLFVNWKLSS